jgi:uncharacterized protein
VKGFLRNMNIPSMPLAEMLMFYGSIERGYWAFDYKPAEYAKNIKNIPVLLQWGRMDKRVTQQETDLIFKNLGTLQKQLIIYETAGHESYCKKENLKWEEGMKRFLEIGK